MPALSVPKTALFRCECLTQVVDAPAPALWDARGGLSLSLSLSISLSQSLSRSLSMGAPD